MWFVVANALGAVPLPDNPPEGRLRGLVELRVGHSLVGEAPYRSAGERRVGPTPTGHGTLTAGLGGRVVRGTLALHGAIGHYRFVGTPDFPVPARSQTYGRVEARAGVRVDTAPSIGLFVGAEAGTLLIPVPFPLLVGTVGWTAPGEHVRFVAAVEGRLSGCLAQFSLPPSYGCPAQTGIGLNAGLRR